jgi:murein DD-endopeptidase MepM/ murein hydrolase activator NlpD
LLVACSTPKQGAAYYQVQSGDTLSKIARKHGQQVSNLVRWNNLSNSNQIKVGQLLKVQPNRGKSSTDRSKRLSATPPPPQRAAHVSIPSPASRVALVWPSKGKIIRSFDGAQSKGILITNQSGTPVIAAADGTVVYASRGLRGYGKLVIIQHKTNFLTIYAHNRKLLIEEGQRVRQGQAIAEMGDSDAKQVGLYFELRYDGRAIDPAPSLPKL